MAGKEKGKLVIWGSGKRGEGEVRGMVKTGKGKAKIGKEER